MAIKVLELHHHGIRVRPEKADECKTFYEDVLGLRADPGRPNIPGIPGYWMDCGNDTQIHIMGCEGVSRYAQGGPDKDPTRLHVALAIPDVQEAKEELERLGVAYWTIKWVVGPSSSRSSWTTRTAIWSSCTRSARAAASSRRGPLAVDAGRP